MLVTLFCRNQSCVILYVKCWSHYFAGFVEPGKTEYWVDSKKLCPGFASGQTQRRTVRIEFSLSIIIITLWSTFPVLKLYDLQSIFLFLLLNHLADSDRGIVQFLSTHQLLDMPSTCRSDLFFVQELLELCICPCQQARNKGAHHIFGMCCLHAWYEANSRRLVHPCKWAKSVHNLIFQKLEWAL